MRMAMEDTTIFLRRWMLEEGGESPVSLRKAADKIAKVTGKRVTHGDVYKALHPDATRGGQSAAKENIFRQFLGLNPILEGSAPRCPTCGKVHYWEGDCKGEEGDVRYVKPRSKTVSNSAVKAYGLGAFSVPQLRVALRMRGDAQWSEEARQLLDAYLAN